MPKYLFTTTFFESVPRPPYFQTIFEHVLNKIKEFYGHVGKMTLAKIRNPLDGFLDDNTKVNNELQT